MCKLIIVNLIFLFFVNNIFSQDSLYLKKIDTLFIIYDNPLSNNHIVREYSGIKSKGNSIIGLNSIYFLLDSILVNNREYFYKRFKEVYDKGGGNIGASTTCDWCFGLYFVHKSTKRNLSIKEFKNSYMYNLMIKQHFLEKENVTLKDSLNHDKQAFIKYRGLNPPSANLIFSKKELSKKNVLYFDGSTKKYNDLKELLKEPIYLFMLDKKWVKQELNSTKTEYYIFNEVRYRNSYKLVPD